MDVLTTTTYIICVAFTEKTREPKKSRGEITMDGGDDLRKQGDGLHRRLLADRNSQVIAEITELFLPLLIKALTRRFPNLRDPHLVETFANDSLLNYFEHPEKFDPSKRSLIGYLYMDAYGNLLNFLKQQHRRAEIHRIALENELGEVAQTDDPESLLIGRESPLIRQMKGLVDDPVDRELVALMMDGVRDTEAYAEALGLQALSVAEQAVVVKRHKDRLKATLRRGINRRRLALIFAFLAGLRQRARAFGSKPRLIAASVLVLAILSSVGIYLWQKNRAAITGNVGGAAGAGTLSDGSIVRGPGGLMGRYGEKIFFSSNRGAAPGTAQAHVLIRQGGLMYTARGAK